VQDVDAETIGRASLLLGAGRTKTTDVIDPAAGISGLVKIGEHVEAGQPLATLHAATQARIEEARQLMPQAFVISEGTPKLPLMILERVE